jgi:hypothetical protein
VARTIRFLVAGLILCSGGLSQNPREATGQTAVVFSSEKALPAGTLAATIETPDGRKINARLVVEGAKEATPSTAPPVAPSPPSMTSGGSVVATQPLAETPPSSGLPIGIVIALAIVPAILVAGGVWYYFARIQPGRIIKQYTDALKAVDSREYGTALPLLTVVEGKLPPELHRQARFFVAFVNAQLKNTADAMTIAAALHREDASDAEAAELLAWLYVSDKKYESAEAVLKTMRKSGSLGKEAACLLSCTKFAQAMKAYRAGGLDQASVLFNDVRELGHFADQIPADLRDRHVALGARALFDHDAAAARTQFEALDKASASLLGEVGRQMAAKAKVGLALAAWVDGDTPTTESMIEVNLAAAAQLLKQSEPLDLPWPDTAAASGVTAADRLEGLERPTAEPQKDKPESQDLTEQKQQLTLRDIHFLRAMNVLRGWKLMEPEQAQQQVPGRYRSALGRLAAARAHDSEFSHIYLVAGLLMYYLRTDAADRMRGVHLLDRARDIGMREPETMEILHHRDKMNETNQDARTRFMDVLDKYIGDETVRLEVRRDLLTHLSKYGRFAGVKKRPDLSSARNLPPTIEEVRNRSELLRTRVAEIIQSGDQDAKELHSMTASVEEESQRLWEQAKTVENKQAELVTATGDFLFKD